MVMVMVVVRTSMQVRMRISVSMRVKMKMRIAYASVFDIPCVDVGVADFLIGRSFRKACRMVHCICFPAYVG